MPGGGGGGGELSHHRGRIVPTSGRTVSFEGRFVTRSELSRIHLKPATQRSYQLSKCVIRFHGVMVSTLDSESSDPISNLCRTCVYFLKLWSAGISQLGER